ncbi:hypothetical protein IE53DRAFT_113472 [Violaceomyces palustris]|uniref:Uncharacterized protein n=1 Tax=Violaceomyces palustris TaxID=1673888 RepID=A0ACD0NW63_9BASI|nr:hypothetical protein IE53DRAFT_113472 [Violaceomyces palustris]
MVPLIPFPNSPASPLTLDPQTPRSLSPVSPRDRSVALVQVFVQYHRVPLFLPSLFHRCSPLISGIRIGEA